MFFDIVKLDPVNNYLLLDQNKLKQLKRTISEDNLKNYIKDMDHLFSAPLESVVTKEANLSGDPHDYVSLATYWWPDENTNDGYPYIQRDGYANPEGLKYDKDKLRRLAFLTYHASILRYLTNDAKYSDLIEKHLNYFFIDEDTKMNPNLNYGQFIPGNQIGRKEGIIDYTANFTYALYILMTLEEMSLISENLVRDLKVWHHELLNWLLTSEIGVAEGEAINNHGTFYDLGCVVVAKFVDRPEVVNHFKDKFSDKRVKVQIDSKYRLPLELERTKSLSYTFMGLKGLIELSELFDGLEKPTIEKSINWVINNTFNNKWPYEQVTQFDPGIYLLEKQLYEDYTKLNSINIKVNKDDVINKTLWYLHQKRKGE